MNRITARVLGLVLVLTACLAVSTSPAQSASRGCVNWHEFNTVYRGWPDYAVESHFGTRGSLVWEGHGPGNRDDKVKVYRGCSNGPLRVRVYYERIGTDFAFRLSSKRARL